MSTEPGHTVRRKRKSSETEYQYRKRQTVTSNSTDEESNQTVDEDEAAVTAMSIHRSLKFAMFLGKKDLPGTWKDQRRGRPGPTTSRTQSTKDKDHWRFKTHSHDSSCVSRYSPP